ncbi:MAG: DsrE family protein [Candidatus Bipolaricaulota bacterium]|nr:MAG: DsrE family protein [Candidatus Bipolaricaulota bacterium]
MADKIAVILTSRDPVALEMGFLYARNARKEGWMRDVRLFLFGSSEIAVATEPALREMVETSVAEGLVPRACKFCADKYGVTEPLEGLGCVVEYVGQSLSDALHDGCLPMTW